MVELLGFASLSPTDIYIQSNYQTHVILWVGFRFALPIAVNLRIYPLVGWVEPKVKPNISSS